MSSSNLCRHHRSFPDQNSDVAIRPERTRVAGFEEYAPFEVMLQQSSMQPNIPAMTAVDRTQRTGFSL
jgi:hypothetical protein